MTSDALGCCDVCGRSATSMSRDIVEEVDWVSGRITVRPCRPEIIKRGCDAHPAKSDAHRTPAYVGLLRYIAANGDAGKEGQP